MIDSIDSLSPLNGAPSVPTHCSVELPTVTGRNADESALSAPVTSGRSVPTFLISDEDRAGEFGDIPSVDERTRIQARLALFEEIYESGNIERACKKIARLHGWDYDSKGKQTREGEEGYAWRTIYNQFYLYTRGGTKNGVLYGACDWRVLRDTRKLPDERIGLPWKFRQFWNSFRVRFQRNGGDKAAHRALLRIWREHVATIPLEIGGKPFRAGNEIPFIPGYPEWPEADAITEVPAGWTYQNLNRVALDEFFNAVIKRGRSHAADLRPKVSTTREGLKYGQLYYFDDQQYDEHVNYLGVARKAMRPWGLDCLEALSACHVANLFKPTIVDDIEQVKRRLREIDMVWFAIHVLMTEGYRADTGTILAGEHGTSTLRDRFADPIARITGKKVLFDAGGLEGAPPFAGMFEGKGGGNPRHKSPLESIRNLVRNEMSALPGAAGKDRDHSPETNVPDKGGQFRYNTILLKAAEALPEEQRKRLQFPFLDWHQFVQLALYFVNVIDRRDDHDLKHWHRCGFVVEAFRLEIDQPWRSMDDFLALPAEQQSILRELLKKRPELTSTRKLSPWQVRKHLRKDPALRKLPPSVLPEIFGLESEFARECVVKRDLTIEINDREIDAEPMIYHACVRSRFGGDEWLPRGMTFIGFLDHITGALHLFDARANRRGAYVGTCHLQEDAPLSNRDALAKACGAIAKIEHDFLAPVAKAGGEIARRNLDMRRHNAEVAAEATTGLTARQRKKIENEDRARERRREALAATAQEDLSAFSEEVQTPRKPRRNKQLDALSEFDS